MAAAPGALPSAVTDNRINEFVFKAVLHVLVYAYMELAAIVIERPGTELVYVTVALAYSSPNFNPCRLFSWLWAQIQKNTCAATGRTVRRSV